MRAQAARPAVQPGPLVALRRSGALRPKLAVGPVDDAYEREADAVAAAVMAGGSAGLVATGAAGTVQRQPASPSGSPPAPVLEQLRPVLATYEVDTKTDGQKLGKGAGEAAGQALDTAPGKVLQDAASALLGRDWQKASTAGQVLMVVAGLQLGAVVGGLKAIPEADEGPPTPEKTPRIKISEDFRVQLELKLGWKDKAADGTEIPRRIPRVDSITVSLIWAPEGPKGPPDAEVVAAEIARLEAALRPFRPTAKGDGFAVDYAARRMIEERKRHPSWLPPKGNPKLGEEPGRFRLDAGPFGSRPRPGLRLVPELGLVPPGTVQRKCAACAADDEGAVRLKPGSMPAGTPAATADAAVAGLGPGLPLPAVERAFFEPRLDRNLADVRIHAETPAATALGARAFALGRDVAFAPGEWRPGTAAGRGLLAHELVHVLQQDRGAPAAVRRQLVLTPPVRPPPVRPPPVRLPPSVIVPKPVPRLGTPGTGNAPGAIEGPGQLDRYAPEQPSPDLYDAFERGSRIMADENEATTAGEFPRATLDRGGTPPDFVTQGPPGAAQTPSGTVHFRTRRFHVLDAITAAVPRAQSLGDLAQIVATFINDSQRGQALLSQIQAIEAFAKPENGSLQLMMRWGGGAMVDPGGTRRLETFATAAERQGVARPLVATLAQYRTWADRLHQRVPRVEGSCSFMPVRPHAGGNARHNAYATHVTGSEEDVLVRSPEGIVSQYDGRDAHGQYWEVKTRYGYLEEYKIIVDLDKRYLPWMRIVSDLEEQRARGVWVAARCGLRFAFAFDNRRVAEFMHRQWGNVPPVHYYKPPRLDGPVAPGNEDKP